MPGIHIQTTKGKLQIPDILKEERSPTMAGSHETPVFSKRMKTVCHTGSTAGEEQHEKSWCALSLHMWSETSAQGTVSLISRVSLTKLSSLQNRSYLCPEVCFHDHLKSRQADDQDILFPFPAPFFISCFNLGPRCMLCSPMT